MFNMHMDSSGHVAVQGTAHLQAGKHFCRETFAIALAGHM